MKKEALFEYLLTVDSEVELDEIKQTEYNDSYFETPYGDYYVYTNSEADEACVDYIENLIDDLGITGIWKPGTWQFDEVLKYINCNSLWENIEEYNRGYLEDIKYEDDNIFETRQQQEMIELLHNAKLLPVDYNELIDHLCNDVFNEKCAKFLYEWEKNEEEYLDICTNILTDRDKEQYDSPIEYYNWHFGEDEINALLENNHISIDYERIAEWCNSVDGRGHTLSSYDGEEHEIDYEDETYFIYRCN